MVLVNGSISSKSGAIVVPLNLVPRSIPKSVALYGDAEIMRVMGTAVIRSNVKSSVR